MGLYFKIGESGDIQRIYKVRAMADTPRPRPISLPRQVIVTYGAWAPIKTLFSQGDRIVDFIRAVRNKQGADLIEAIEKFADETGFDVRVDVDPVTRAKLFADRDGGGGGSVAPRPVIVRYVDP